MPRIEPLPHSELEPEFRELVDKDLAEGRDPALNGILGLRPELFRRYFEFYYPAHEQGEVPARIKELARLKIARLNDCPVCNMARYASATREGLDEACIAQLDLPTEDQELTEPERLAVEFAERMAVDHQGIGDDFVHELQKHFSDGQILELATMIGQYLGFGRALVALGIDSYSARPYVPGLG